MRPVVPALPPRAPRTKSNAFARWFCRGVLRLGGWRMVGQWPNLDKVVVIVAPHSSGWDGVWGLAAKIALGVHIVFIGKTELFRGPLGCFLRRLGGVPVDRSAPGGIVDQVAQQIVASERMWFVLAPEGTRRYVKHWKTGFWKIAKRADVPVFCAWFHYPTKEIGLGPLVELTDDMDADLMRIRALFAPYQGKNRGAA
jgi:1-acyl-sn-glycerol-3-phosphate acyltransferase